MCPGEAPKTMPHSIPALLTVPETQQLLGARGKALRLAAGFKRTTLAERAGLSARTLQRFEDSGQVSLTNLLRLAHALGRQAEFGALLEPAPARTLAELDARDALPAPKRGRI